MIVVSSHGGYGDLGQYSLKFYNGNTAIVNVHPIVLPPIIDVVCDPFKPVFLPGRVLGQNVVTTSQLNLNTLNTVAKPGNSVVSDSLPTTTSSAKQTPTTFNALDEAFASFGKKLTVF